MNEEKDKPNIFTEMLFPSLILIRSKTSKQIQF